MVTRRGRFFICASAQEGTEVADAESPPGSPTNTMQRLWIRTVAVPIVRHPDLQLRERPCIADEGAVRPRPRRAPKVAPSLVRGALMPGRRRYVNTTISKDSAVNRLANEYGYFASTFYTWMIPHAEDDASLPLDHDELRMMVVPGFKKLKMADIDRAIEGMLALGLLCKDDHCYYFPPESFYKHQSYIKEDRRRTIASDQNAEDQRKTAQNSEVPRIAAKVAQNAASDPIRSGSDQASLSVDGVDRATRSFATFGHVTAGTADAIEWAIKDYGVEEVEAAVREAAGAGFEDKPPWSYVETILERWKKQGGRDEPKPRLQAVGRAAGYGRLSASDRAEQLFGTS